MIKLALILSFTLSALFTQPDFTSKSDQNQSVYICVSKGAKKYHYKKNCRGLNSCSHEIKKVTISDAKGKYNKTLCGWED